MTTKSLLEQTIRDFPQLEGKSDSYIDAFLAVRLDKKPVCKKGKLCNDVCIPKNAKCRNGNSSAKTDITSNEELHSNLARYGFVGGGVAVAAIVAGAGAQIAYDVKKITDNAQPTKEEETVNYDDFKPGDLIRKRTILAGAAVHHYAVYAGKDPKTGEPQIIHTEAPNDENHQTSSSVITKTSIYKGSIKTTGSPQNASKRYVKVPESEMYQKEGSTRFSRAEILKRANQAVGTDYTFHTFSSNCEVFARGVTEGVAYSAQGESVSPLTRALGDFSSEAFTVLTKKQYLTTKSRKTGAEIVAHLNKESRVRRDSENVRDIGYGYINVLESNKTFSPTQNAIDDYCDLVGIKRPEIYSEMVNELTRSLGTLKKATQIKMYSDYAQVFFGTIKSEEILGSIAKNDSYSEGFDSVRTDKKANCSPKSKHCGDRCIKKEWECHEGKPHSIATPTQIESPGVAIGLSVGTAAGVGGAIAIGSAATYAMMMKQKAEYRANMVNVAARAKEAARDIPIPKIPKKQKNISLIVGGFGTEDAYSESLKLERAVRSLGGLDDHYFEPIEYKDYNIAQNTSKVDFQVATTVAKQSWDLYKNVVIKNKGNPVAEKLSAKVYAYSQAYPDKTINLVGHSGGGLTSQETAEITKMLGVRTKVTAIGTPNFFGFLEPTEDSVTLYSPNDEIQKASVGAPLNTKRFNNVKHHDIESYFEDPEVKDFVRDRLKTESRIKKDSEKEQDSQCDTGNISQNYYSRSYAVQLALWNLAKNDNRTDAINPSSFNEKKLLAQLRALLTRATGNVDAIGNVESKEPGKVTGLFKDGTQVLEFTLTNDNLKYKAATGKRVDGLETREDTTKKKSRCQRGIACGSSCIAKNKTCELNVSKLASPSELTKLRQSVVAFNLEQNATQPQNLTSENQPQEDPYKNNTIRELKKIASQKGVVGYSNMTTEQLRSAISLVDKTPPEQQERIARTLAKDRSSINRAASAAGLRGKQRRAAADASRTWKNLESLAKFAASQPVGWGVAATGAFLLGASIRSYERAKGDYRSRLKENAEQAQEKAATLSPTRVGQLNNITFVVGSAKAEENKPSGAQHIIDKLKESVKDSDDEGEKWLANKQFFIPFDLKESGAPVKGSMIEDAVSGLKDYMGNFLKKKDQDAIDLAAQLYAYGIQRTPDTRKKRDLNKLDRGLNQLNKNKAKLDKQYKNDLENEEYKAKAASIDAEIKKNRQGYKAANAKPDKGDRPLANKGKNINILAHSRGGQTAKTALEYLARMNIPGEPSGKEVLEQVNLVMLGTPHFGFTENVSKRQRTLISAQDPVSKLPVFGEGARQEWVSSVKGHGAEDYIKDPRARESIREAFGYYQDSLLQRKRKQRKNNNDSSDDRADSQKGIKCGKGYISVGEKCKSVGTAKEYKRKILKASLGRGVIAGNIGGIGNDIERAYVKTKRLVKRTKSQIQKKELTRKEKILDEVTYQLKHLGIIAGKGTISKKLRGLDKKLIDLEEGIKELPESVQNALKKVVEAVKKKAGQVLGDRQEKTDAVDTYWNSFIDTLIAPAIKLATEEVPCQPEPVQLK